MREITFVKKWTQSCDLFPFQLFPIKIPIDERLIHSQRFSGLSQATQKRRNYLYEFPSLPQGEFRNK
jgi:hypothetical protein